MILIVSENQRGRFEAGSLKRTHHLTCVSGIFLNQFAGATSSYGHSQILLGPDEVMWYEEVTWVRTGRIAHSPLKPRDCSMPIPQSPTKDMKEAGPCLLPALQSWEAPPHKMVGHVPPGEFRKRNASWGHKAYHM